MDYPDYRNTPSARTRVLEAFMGGMRGLGHLISATKLLNVYISQSGYMKESEVFMQATFNIFRGTSKEQFLL